MARMVRTLHGRVLYQDSGWTEAEWALIESAMSRCSGVSVDRRASRGNPRRPDALTLWDVSEHVRLDRELDDSLFEA